MACYTCKQALLSHHSRMFSRKNAPCKQGFRKGVRAWMTIFIRCQWVAPSRQRLPSAGAFPGLIPLITSYLSGMDVDAYTHCTIQQYLKLIQRRASGELLTTAQWLRKFVTSHPDYRKDSVITEKMNYDLLKTIDKIQSGVIPCQDLLGAPLISKTQDSVPQSLSKAECPDC